MSNGTPTASANSHHWIVVLAGVLLIASPWILQYSETVPATWNAAGIGTFIAVLGLFSLVNFAEWQDWFAGFAGLWVAVSPWIAGFSGDGTATATQLILGAVVCVLSFWRVRQLHGGGASQHA